MAFKKNCRYLSLVSLFYIFNLLESYSMDIDEEEKGIVTKISNFSQLERRIQDNFNGFESKVQHETTQKDSLIKETEQGLEEKSKRLQVLVTNIDQQKNYINSLIDQIHVQVNERNRQSIPSELIVSLKKEISSIGVPYHNLGDTSSYHDYQKYQQPNPNGYTATKSSSYLQNICDQIESCAALIHNLVYQNSDSIWDRSGTILSKGENARNVLYSNSTSVHSTLKAYSGSWYQNLASKTNDGDNYVINMRNEAESIRSIVDSIKSQVSSIRSHASSLKSEIRSYESDSDSKISNNKSLMQAESWNRAKDYGDIILQKSLEKGRVRIVEVHQSAINLSQSRIERLIPIYFDKRDLSNSQSYHFKIEPIQQNVITIRQATTTINSASREINDISHQFLHIAKDQHKKININYGALVKKGTELEETAKGLSKEFLIMTQSLVVVVKDKKEQVKKLKKAENDLKDSFKQHEEFLVKSHEIHVSDLKEQKSELLKLKEEMIDDKLKIVKELEEENNDLRIRMSSYEKRIQEVSLKDQNELKIKMVDSMLEAMMSLLQVDISDIKNLNMSGPEFAQQCLIKIVQGKALV